MGKFWWLLLFIFKIFCKYFLTFFSFNSWHLIFYLFLSILSYQIRWPLTIFFIIFFINNRTYVGLLKSYGLFLRYLFFISCFFLPFFNFILLLVLWQIKIFSRLFHTIYRFLLRFILFFIWLGMRWCKLRILTEKTFHLFWFWRKKLLTLWSL